jgi:hypothetical protein
MYFNLFEVRGGIGQSVPYVAISYSNTGWQLHTYNTDTPIASMPVNGWAMFSLVVTFSTTISATLTINSETPIIGASTGTASAIGGTVELALGISSTLYAPPGNYEYDNVLVEVQ